MLGIGRECGTLSRSPRWRRRSNTPASIRAEAEKGGVFTSPRNQTSGLPIGRRQGIQYMSYMTYCQVAV